MKVPRKKKKLIPTGLYCYTATSGFKKFPNGSWGFTTKVCPYYTHIKVKDIPLADRPKWMDDKYVNEFPEVLESWCRLVKTDITDQCKSCGLKYGKL